MRVSSLATGLRHARLVGNPPDHEITEITNDSRLVITGALYAALPGMRVDGHRFIPDAISAGAAAILCEQVPQHRDSSIAWLTADDSRMALSEIADRFHGSPSREIDVIGVTGTDGKTSTVYFVHQLLATLTGASSFLSTAAMQVGPHEEPNRLHQSTPEAPQVHRVLRAMADHGSRYAVVESTSHGLSRRTARLAHVSYRAAVFTNLSHEHLEFHGTFERYRSDKANLFRALDAGCYADADETSPTPVGEDDAAGARARFAVVNADDGNAAYFAAATARRVVRYAIDADADYRAADVEAGTTGSRFLLATPSGTVRCSLPVPGRFNVANVLAAAAVAQTLTGCSDEQLAEAIARLRSVRGRMTVVQEAPFSVVVDYAHTPGSFETVLPFFREQCRGRLIVVFGSAGDRDVAKRPLQGAIADRYADVIILADEDPRSEDRMEILRQIATGCPSRRDGETIHLVPDRRLAIRRAIEIAELGDTVLLLGKGHEQTIIGSTETMAWDEIAVAGELLGEIQGR